MAAQELGFKTALDIIVRSRVELVYIYASYFRRNARKFRAISEGPTLFHRVSLTAALAFVCIIASYLFLLLDPAKDFPGLMSAEKRAVWAALVPILAVLPMYWLLRRYSTEPVFFTFLNLGFVTSAAVMVIPGIIALAGFHASSIDTDYASLRAGRADGTAVYDLFCGGLERQGAELALLSQQERTSSSLEAVLSVIPAGREEMYAKQQETNALAQRITMAGGPSPSNRPLVDQYLAAMQERLLITRREVSRSNERNRLMKRYIAGLRRAIDLQDQQTFAPWRVLKAYPVATFFLAIAWIVGVVLWLFAASICWSLVVKTQKPKRRRRFAGLAVVGLFFVTMAGFGLLRSGILEAFMQEEPTEASLQGQLRARYQVMASMCPNLNTHALW